MLILSLVARTLTPLTPTRLAGSATRAKAATERTVGVRLVRSRLIIMVRA
jgi:hypothetical protein